MSQFTQFKSLGLINRGAYSSSVTYTINDVVTSGSKSYVCKVVNSTNVPVTTTANWDVLADSAEVQVATTGTGTNPANFTLSAVNNVITLNRG